MQERSLPLDNVSMASASNKSATTNDRVRFVWPAVVAVLLKFALMLASIT